MLDKSLAVDLDKDAPVTTGIISIGPSTEDLARPGIGFLVREGSLFSAPSTAIDFESDPAKPSELPFATNYEASLSLSGQTFNSTNTFALAAEARYLLAHGSFSGTWENSLDSHATSLKITLTYRQETDPWAILNPRLKPDLPPVGSPAFIVSYGTHFVAGYSFKSSVSLTFQTQDLSEQERTALHMAMSGGYGTDLTPGSVNGSAKWGSILDRAFSNMTGHIAVSSEGFENGLQIPDLPADSKAGAIWFTQVYNRFSAAERRPRVERIYLRSYDSLPGAASAGPSYPNNFQVAALYSAATLWRSRVSKLRELKANPAAFDYLDGTTISDLASRLPAAEAYFIRLMDKLKNVNSRGGDVQVPPIPLVWTQRLALCSAAIFG